MNQPVSQRYQGSSHARNGPCVVNTTSCRLKIGWFAQSIFGGVVDTTQKAIIAVISRKAKNSGRLAFSAGSRHRRLRMPGWLACHDEVWSSSEINPVFAPSRNFVAVQR